MFFVTIPKLPYGLKIATQLISKASEIFAQICLATTQSKKRCITDSLSVQNRQDLSAYSFFTHIISSQDLVLGEQLEKEMDPGGILRFQTAGRCTGVTPLKFMTLYKDWEE